eukprot:CCRYP_010890-RA/>CCRYP_010890-RA protein AED:0.02 eAED:0.02 QI:411/1/1/1/0.5/0.42/7/4533/2209
MSSNATNRDGSESCATDAPHSIFLSMKNDDLKSIIYRHFRILGKKRDRGNDGKAQEDDEARRVLDDLIQNAGNGVHEVLFYKKAKGDVLLHVSREKALEFIRDAINNRDKTSHLWLINDERGENELVQSMSAEKESGAMESELPTEHDNESDETPKKAQSSEAAAAENSNIESSSKLIPITRRNRRSPSKSPKTVAASNRRISRIPHKTIANITDKLHKSQSTDILLSMMDPYYRQVMFHHYERRMNETSPSNNSEMASEIYETFQKKLRDSGGAFYKVACKGGGRCLVESEEEILKKIKIDLNKSKNYQNEMNSTLVLDQERNLQFARIMYKYYNILGLERDEERENDIAAQVLKELKENFNAFARILNGERVVVDKDDIVRNLILESIRRRGECRIFWFDEGVSKNEGQNDVINRKRPRRSSVLDAAAGQSSTSSPIFLRTKRKASTSLPPQNVVNPANKPPSNMEQSESKEKTKSKALTSRNPTFSPLNHRLPPRKCLTITPRTPIDTVSQLIQIVQLATHKLNELHGTSRRHCKVIRLHHLVEFGGESSGVPTLAELAEHMRTTQRNIRKWCEMCLHAEKRGFDFEKYLDDKLDLHSAMFEGREGDDDILLVNECAEIAIDNYFDRVVRDALQEVGKSDVIDTAGDGSVDKTIELENKVEVKTKADVPAEKGDSAQETKMHDKEYRVRNDADEKIPSIVQEKNEVEEGAIEENGNTQYEGDQPDDNNSRNDAVDKASSDASQKENSLNENTSLNEEMSLNPVVAESFANKEHDTDIEITTGDKETDAIPFESIDQMSPIDSENHENKVLNASMTEGDHEVVAKHMNHPIVEKAEQSSTDSLEPSLVDLDISEDNARDVLNVEVNEDVNASYNEVKCSIEQISDAIGLRSGIEKARVDENEKCEKLSSVGSPMNSPTSALVLGSSTDEGAKRLDEPNRRDFSQHPDLSTRGSSDEYVSETCGFISSESTYQSTQVDQEDVNLESSKYDSSVLGSTDDSNATRIGDDFVTQKVNSSQRPDLSLITAPNVEVTQERISPASDNLRQNVEVADANMPDSITRKDNLQPLLTDITPGSRVFVKWGRDADLYRATVIKVLTDRNGPALKVHYDGKKSHIVDKVRLEMIEGFIRDDEKNSQHTNTSHIHDTKSSENDASITELLRGKYPGTLPFGKLENREQCPELGTGWTVYFAARRSQPASQHRDRIRADRYFISPSGRSFRSVSTLEKYLLEYPEEFDLSSTENGIANSETGTAYHEKTIHIVEGELVPFTGGRQNKITTPENGKRLQIDQGLGGRSVFSPRYQGEDRQEESETHHFGTDNFSPLIMGHPGQAIEDSHSDNEFLTSLLDEKGFLFGDEGMEDENSSTNCCHNVSIEACSLQPMKSCVRCPVPDPKKKADDHHSLKKVVHYAAEESDAPHQETTVPRDEDKKKRLSPRMKSNKKSLIAGMVPVFAMDITAGAEFAGYLADMHREDGCDDESDDEVSLISRTSLTDAEDFVAKNTCRYQLRHQDGIKQHSVSQLSPKLSPITVRKPNKSSSFVRISPIALHRNKAKRRLNDSESGIGALPSHDDLPTENESAVVAESTQDLHFPLQGTDSRPQVEEPNSNEVQDAEYDENLRHKHAMKLNSAKHLSELKCASSPNDVVMINMKPSHSAFVAVPRAIRPGLAPPAFPPSSHLVSSEPSKAGNVQLFAFKYDSEEVDKSTSRPKRKLKCTIRFDPEIACTQANVCKTGHGFLCPRCKYVCEYDSKLCSGCQLECYYEAGVGVVVLKERASVVADQAIPPIVQKANASLSTHARPEGVLCNCTYCGRHHLSIQGIYAHHGRSHQSHGKLDWSNVTFSCPFCKSSEIFTLEEAERHVREHHPGSELVTPNTLKPSRNRSRSKGAASPLYSSLHPNKLRVSRTKNPPSDRIAETDINSHKVTHKWATLDYKSLLSDCKQDYPRDICNILDLVDEQCKAQEELTESAREQRLKLCRAEAEIEAKVWEDDRLAYQRGIRERSRYADAERIEKQRFIESHKLRLLEYEYENRNRKRTRHEVEAEKLCSKPIVFSSGKGRNLPQERVLCIDEQCELCKNDSTYLQSVMLNVEMTSLRKDQPSSQAFHPAVNLLNPSFRELTENYFAEAEKLFEVAKVAKSIGGKHEGNRKINNSRRDIATSKRLRIEEDKLFKMKRTQHSLLFVSRYNEGFDMKLDINKGLVLIWFIRLF